jgi:RsiW-degrading membrane proteinase PrsW (M82 family)
MPDPKKDSRFSVDAEPWQRSSGFSPDRKEESARIFSGSEDKNGHFRDSVLCEPVYAEGEYERDEFQRWFIAKKAGTTFAGNVGVTLVAILIAGPFALLGALLARQQTAFSILYLVLFGPVAEELLKQAGMIFLVERMPYRLFSPLQFICVAAGAGFCFAAIENLIYIHVYSLHFPDAQRQILAEFRWTVCTALHVLCCIIASLGLIRVWRKQQEDGKPANLSLAFPYFTVAIAVHGLYNMVALMTDSSVFFRS